MNTGEYIKHLRMGNNPRNRRFSQEEIGKMMMPPLNRSAIHKWETGQIKTIKKDYIEQLAKIFGVTPTEIMCFDSAHNTEEITEDLQLIEQIQSRFGKDAVQLLQYFTELNDIGRQKALDSVGDLTEIPKYTE